MGKRGPRPKPSELKKLEGTYRKDRVAKREVQPPLGTPDRPAHLDPVAAAEWDRVVSVLGATGVLTRIDGVGLEAYCTNYAMALWFQGVAIKAPMIRTLKGALKINPAVTEARKYWQLVRQFLSEYGMTPAARTRVSAPAGSEQSDQAEEFLFGRMQLIPGGRQ